MVSNNKTGKFYIEDVGGCAEDQFLVLRPALYIDIWKLHWRLYCQRETYRPRTMFSSNNSKTISLMLAAATLLIRPFMDFFRASQDSL